MTDKTPIDWKTRIERELHVQEDSESHVEEDPSIFHPSQLAHCERQCVKSKLGLEEQDSKTLGTFYTGTMIHEWLESIFTDTIPGVHHEIPVEKEYITETDAITVTGTADVYDEFQNVVYDFKSRGGWYRFDPPVDRHLDQLTLYMDALGADSAQVVYVNKKNLEVRTWPEDDVFAFDPGRRDELIDKARRIRDALRETEVTAVDEIPFDPCDCWLCQRDLDDDDE